MVISFDGTADGRTILAKVVEMLKSKSPPVFLIVDTYVPGQQPRTLQAEEFKLLEGFLWYVPTNFPSQLVAQAQMLIRRDSSVLAGGTSGKL